MKRLRLTAALALMAAGAPVRAEWMQASSRHFTIYSDSSPAAITELGRRMEQVDAALRLISGVEDTPESAANPVTIYVLPDSSAVERLLGGRGASGFYIGRADGAVAFTARLNFGEGQLGQQILFHEYAHHFLLAGSHMAFPAWLSEGFAEFVSTARFDKERLVLGGVVSHHAGTLFGGDNALTLPAMLAPRARMTEQQRAEMYGRGWVLTHYLLTDPDRKALMDNYLRAVNTGKPPLDAATEAFGDLKALERTLGRYVGSSRLSAFVIPLKMLPDVAVRTRALTAGERALIDHRIVSTRGVNPKTAAPLYERAARAAAPFPNDPVAQGWLAEMAFDAGRDAEAEAAADRALAADPKSAQALLYKGRVHLKRLQGREKDGEKWAAARAWIIRANRLEPNAAAPLSHFHGSFEMEGVKPRRSAVDGLHRAAELAPQDVALRYRSARQRLADGEIEEGKRTLRPLAFSAHADPDNPAARLLALLDGGATGPAALATLEAEQKAKAAASSAPAR